MIVRLWYKFDTEKAVLYCKRPPHQASGPADEVWIPRSVMSHRTKFRDGEHHITVPEWFARKSGLETLVT